MLKPWEDGPQVGYCCICGCEIYEGESICYADDGEMICEECMENAPLKEYLIEYLNGRMEEAEVPGPPEEDD